MVNVKNLKKGNYYRFYYDNKSRYVVGKCSRDNSCDCEYGAADERETNRYPNEYWNSPNFGASSALDFATQEEIDWLEQCHSEGSWVPFIKNKELQIEIW